LVLGFSVIMITRAQRSNKTKLHPRVLCVWVDALRENDQKWSGVPSYS